jgi:hypothetical protein
MAVTPHVRSAAVPHLSLAAMSVSTIRRLTTPHSHTYGAPEHSVSCDVLGSSLVAFLVRQREEVRYDLDAQGTGLSL